MISLSQILQLFVLIPSHIDYVKNLSKTFKSLDLLLNLLQLKLLNY